MTIEPFARRPKGDLARVVLVVLLPIIFGVSVLIGYLFDWGMAATVFFGMLSLLLSLRPQKRQ